MPDPTTSLIDTADTYPACTPACWRGDQYDPQREPRDVARLVQVDLVRQGLPARVTIRHGRWAVTGEVYLMVRLPIEYHARAYAHLIQRTVWAYGRAHSHEDTNFWRPFGTVLLTVPGARLGNGGCITPPLTSLLSSDAVEPDRRTAWTLILEPAL